MDTQTFTVSGMTCGHCVSAVTEEITSIAPSAEVTIELGEPSHVTIAGAQLSDDQIRLALDEAGGYVLVPSN